MMTKTKWYLIISRLNNDEGSKKESKNDENKIQKPNNHAPWDESAEQKLNKIEQSSKNG